MPLDAVAQQRQLNAEDWALGREGRTPHSPTPRAAYLLMVAAESAYAAELRREYGDEWAGAMCDERGTATVALDELRDAVDYARTTYHTTH